MDRGSLRCSGLLMVAQLPWRHYQVMYTDLWSLTGRNWMVLLPLREEEFTERRLINLESTFKEQICLFKKCTASWLRCNVAPMIDLEYRNPPDDQVFPVPEISLYCFYSRVFKLANFDDWAKKSCYIWNCWFHLCWQWMLSTHISPDRIVRLTVVTMCHFIGCNHDRCFYKIDISTLNVKGLQWSVRKVSAKAHKSPQQH